MYNQLIMWPKYQQEIPIPMTDSTNKQSFSACIHVPLRLKGGILWRNKIIEQQTQTNETYIHSHLTPHNQPTHGDSR